MIIHPRKYTYHTHLKWLSEKMGNLCCSGKPNIMVACPPEWGGHPDIWSPEDLFVGSLEVCIMTTFLWHIKRKNIRLLSYGSQAKGTASMVNNTFQFSTISIHLTITVSTQIEKDLVKDILKQLKKKCLITQSIKAKVIINADISIK